MCVWIQGECCHGREYKEVWLYRGVAAKRAWLYRGVAIQGRGCKGGVAQACHVHMPCMCTRTRQVRLAVPRVVRSVVSRFTHHIEHEIPCGCMRFQHIKLGQSIHHFCRTNDLFCAVCYTRALSQATCRDAHPERIIRDYRRHLSGSNMAGGGDSCSNSGVKWCVMHLVLNRTSSSFCNRLIHTQADCYI